MENTKAPKSQPARRKSVEGGTDGSVQRLRADIDRGRTGDKVDWPDPAAVPLGNDEEAGGNPTDAATGRSEHRAETVRSSTPRHKRGGIGAA